MCSREAMRGAERALATIGLASSGEALSQPEEIPSGVASSPTEPSQTDPPSPWALGTCEACCSTANLRTKILDFRGFDSSRILIVRGGILMCVGNCPEVLSQRILVGIILVGRLGVPLVRRTLAWLSSPRETRIAREDAGRRCGDALLEIVGWHYLSSATCLIRPHSCYVFFVVSRSTIMCYILRHV